MRKFTTFIENTNKEYIITSEVQLEVLASSEGDASFNANNILDSIKKLSKHHIIKIEEKVELENKSESLNIHVDMNRYKNITSAKDKILKSWEDNFKDKTPSIQDKMEWYHLMRDNKFDGVTIGEVIGEQLYTS